MRVKKIIILILGICLVFTLVFSGAVQVNELKVQVKVKVANIRSQPSLSSKVIDQASEGAVFQALDKKGNWFLIILPAEDDRPEMRLYIHQSVVEVVEEKKIEKGEPEPEKEGMRKEPVSTPPASLRREKSLGKEKFRRVYFLAGFNAGFQEEDIHKTWTEEIYYETATYTIDYGVKSGYPLFASLGFMFTPGLGLEAGVDITSRDMEGTYTSSIPHPLLFGTNRSAEGSSAYSLGENAVTLSAIYVARFGRMGFDVFAGGAYIMAKAKVISEISFSEDYPYESISLSVSSSEITQNVFGFIGGARLLFHVSDGFAFFVNARYLNGKAEFTPDTGIPGPEITLGGFRAGGGLKLLF